jgi:hypothetical protein
LFLRAKFAPCSVGAGVFSAETGFRVWPETRQLFRKPAARDETLRINR